MTAKLILNRSSPIDSRKKIPNLSQFYKFLDCSTHITAFSKNHRNVIRKFTYDMGIERFCRFRIDVNGLSNHKNEYFIWIFQIVLFCKAQYVSEGFENKSKQSHMCQKLGSELPANNKHLNRLFYCCWSPFIDGAIICFM